MRILIAVWTARKISSRHFELVLVLAVQVDNLVLESCLGYGFLEIVQWRQEDVIVTAARISIVADQQLCLLATDS